MKKIIAVMMVLAILVTGVALADTLDEYESNLKGTWTYKDFNHWKLENAAPNLDSITVWYDTLTYPTSSIQLFEDESGKVYLFTCGSTYKDGCLAEIVFSKDKKSFLLIEGDFAVLYQKK